MEADRLSDGPLADALRKHRSHYNQLVAQAEVNHPTFDRDAFRSFLIHIAAPALEAVASETPCASETVANRMVEIGILLTEKSLLGEKRRCAPLPEALARILPAAAPLLAIAPNAVLESVVHAVVTIHRENGCVEKWTDSMSTAAPDMESLDQFRETGLVAAWTSGLAAFRTTAIRLAKRLPTRVVASLFQVNEGRTEKHLEALAADPWLRGKNPPRVARELGDHVGFGGPFIETPQLLLTPDGITVRSGKCCWNLHADCFGVQLIASPPPLRTQTSLSSRWTFDKNGTVTRDGSRSEFPHLAEPAEVMATDEILLVTSPLSFRIFVIV